MRILITGGTGFIGKFLVVALQKTKHQLLVLTSRKAKISLWVEGKNLRIVSGNLGQMKKLEPIVCRFRPEVAIHLAWEGIPDYGVEPSKKNLLYSLNLIELLGQVGCKVFIGAGSCWEYGATTGKISETVVPKATDPFTAAKLSIQLFGEQIAAQSNMKFIWMRFFYVYGPGQKPASLVPMLIQSARKGQVPELKNPSDGNDFVYVEDIVAALVWVVQKSAVVPAGIYNVGSGYITGVQQIVELVMKNCGVASKFSKIKPKGFYADISKLNKATGWQPRTRAEAGIKKTISYYKNL